MFQKSTKDYPGQLYYLESRVMFNEDCIEIVGEPVNDNELCIDTGLGQGLCGVRILASVLHFMAIKR